MSDDRSRPCSLSVGGKCGERRRLARRAVCCCLPCSITSGRVIRRSGVHKEVSDVLERAMRVLGVRGPHCTCRAAQPQRSSAFPYVAHIRASGQASSPTTSVKRQCVRKIRKRVPNSASTRRRRRAASLMGSWVLQLQSPRHRHLGMQVAACVAPRAAE